MQNDSILVSDVVNPQTDRPSVSVLLKDTHSASPIATTRSCLQKLRKYRFHDGPNLSFDPTDIGTSDAATDTIFEPQTVRYPLQLGLQDNSQLDNNPESVTSTLVAAEKEVRQLREALINIERQNDLLRRETDEKEWELKKALGEIQYLKKHIEQQEHRITLVKSDASRQCGAHIAEKTRAFRELQTLQGRVDELVLRYQQLEKQDQEKVRQIMSLGTNLRQLEEKRREQKEKDRQRQEVSEKLAQSCSQYENILDTVRQYLGVGEILQIPRVMVSLTENNIFLKQQNQVINQYSNKLKCKVSRVREVLEKIFAEIRETQRQLTHIRNLANIHFLKNKQEILILASLIQENFKKHEAEVKETRQKQIEQAVRLSEQCRSTREELENVKQEHLIKMEEVEALMKLLEEKEESLKSIGSQNEKLSSENEQYQLLVRQLKEQRKWLTKK